MWSRNRVDDSVSVKVGEGKSRPVESLPTFRGIEGDPIPQLVVSGRMQSDLGFAIEAKVLSDQECDSLLDSLAHATGQRSRAGIRHLMSNADVQRFARDPRLVALAYRYLGVTAVPFRATLFDKSPQTNWLIPWHQDTALPLATRSTLRTGGPGQRKRA